MAGKQGRNTSKGGWFDFATYRVKLLNFLKHKKSRRQMLDFTIFATGVYLMYKFGKGMNESIENQMPTEKKMMEMMREMQG